MLNRCSIAVAEIIEGSQAFFDLLIAAQQESTKTAALEEAELVPQYVTDSSNLALIAVGLSKLTSRGLMPAVCE